MIYKLTLMERMRAVDVLPAQGDIFTVKIMKDLKEKLLLSAEDQDKAELRKVLDENGNETGKIQWNGLYTFDFDLNPREEEMICEGLKRFESEKRLTEDHITLYEKFIESK